MHHSRPLAALAAAAVLLAAGCSNDSSSGSDSTTASTSAATDLTSADTTDDTTDTTTDDTTDDTTDTTTDTTTDDTTDSSDMPLDDRFDRVTEALRDGDFSTTLELLQLSGLADELRDREYTVLAPTEDAFAALDRDQLETLLMNPRDIDDVLRRHILDEVLTYEELADRTEVTTISGETLEVTNVDGEVRVEGALVEEPGDDSMSGESGQEVAVFGIDAVLLEQA